MNKKIDLQEVKAFIDAQGPGTKVYIGADSERFRIQGVWHADYTLAVVVHIDGNKGCKVFGEVQRERDYDQQKAKPRMRLMTEVMKVAQLYLELQDVLGDFPIEVHIDINPNIKYGSSCVAQEAVGYIRALCNVIPMQKPQAWAGSYVADRLKTLIAM